MSDSTDEETLNVLILAEDFYPKESGGAFIDWNVAQHLAECGDSVTVVTPRNEQTPSIEHVDNVEIRRPLRSHGSDTHPNSILGLIWRIVFAIILIPYLLYFARNRNFDLVYSTNHLFHFPATLLGTVFGLVHVSFVGYSPSIQSNSTITDPLVILERINFRYFMGNVALCQTPSISSLLSKLSRAEVDRIDGCVDSNVVQKAIPDKRPDQTDTKTGDEIRLIFVGRLVDIKNPIEAVHLLSTLHPKYRLEIVGAGAKRTVVEEAILEENVSDRTHLAGLLSHEQTLKEIYDSDILILPSKADAYPAVVFEALSLNTPVLATPVGVLPTIDHPHLTTAKLENFDNVLPMIDLETGDGIDENTLERFSVERFTQDVRTHMVSAVSDIPDS